MPTLAEAVTDNPAAVAVLKKHGLLTPDGSWRVTTVDYDDMGSGPLLDPGVVERFAALDTTRSCKVLDWMLLQAGGGRDAINQSIAQLDNAKGAWISDRMAGRGENATPATPMTQEQANAAWAEIEGELRATILPADQDMVEYYLERQVRVFGYTRNWPGPAHIYEQVFKAVKTFLNYMTARQGNQSVVSVVNQARQQRADSDPGTYSPVATELAHYATLDDLEAVNGEFTRFLKKPKAAKNIQFIGREAEPGGALVYKKGVDVKLYDDAYVTVYIPATAAAMMQVGFDNWCVANKTEFDRAFHFSKPEEPNWTRYHRDMGPMAVFHVKPDIVEPHQPKGHEHYLSWKRFAAHLRSPVCEIPGLAEPYIGVQFFDRENRNYPSPVAWSELIDRLSKVHGAEGAVVDPQALLASIRAAMQEFVAWAQQMKAGDIKISVYERMAAMLVHDLLYS